jgi:hypothetical protein
MEKIKAMVMLFLLITSLPLFAADSKKPDYPNIAFASGMISIFFGAATLAVGVAYACQDASRYCDPNSAHPNKVYPHSSDDPWYCSASNNSSDVVIGIMPNQRELLGLLISSGALFGASLMSTAVSCIVGFAKSFDDNDNEPRPPNSDIPIEV